MHVTGLTHDQRGYPVMDAATQEQMIDRLVQKVRNNADRIISYEALLWTTRRSRWWPMGSARGRRSGRSEAASGAQGRAVQIEHGVALPGEADPGPGRAGQGHDHAGDQYGQMVLELERFAAGRCPVGWCPTPAGHHSPERSWPRSCGIKEGHEGEKRKTRCPTRRTTSAHRPHPAYLVSGCGIGTVFGSVLAAIQKSGFPLDDVAMVSGIGCTGRMAGYIKLDSFHTTHGRAIPFATGLKLARPQGCVIVASGDGDLLAIGGNHFIHAARRNMDLTVICVNNFNYGMTGGQLAPSTPFGAKTTTSPLGIAEEPFNFCALAAACGAICPDFAIFSLEVLPKT